MPVVHPRRDFLKAAMGTPIGLPAAAALAQERTVGVEVESQKPAMFEWNLDGVEIAKSADHAEDLVKFAGFEPECARLIVRRVEELLASGLALELVNEKLTRETWDLHLASDRSSFDYRLRFEQRWTDYSFGRAGYLEMSGRVLWDQAGHHDRNGTPLPMRGETALPVIETALPVIWDGMVAAIVALEGRGQIDQSEELRGVIYDDE